jgi:hypothetical protein
MNKRGWLASGLLAAAVIGGYLGLLPLLSSLASGPAWPEPIATRDASGVVTAASSISSDEPNGTPAGDEGVVDESEVVNNDPPTDATHENTGAAPAKTADEPKAVVVRVVGGGLERVTPKQTTPRTNGGGSSTSTDSSGGSASGGATGGGSGGGSTGGGSTGGGSTGGGSSGGGATPPPSIDGFGSGQLAGGGTAIPDEEIEAGG